MGLTYHHEELKFIIMLCCEFMFINYVLLWCNVHELWSVR